MSKLYPDYRPSSDPVSIVGGGPIGLAMSLELARHGVASRIFDKKSGTTNDGSRGILLHRDTLEICERNGAQEILQRGFRPTGRRTFFRETEIQGGKFPVPCEGALPLFVNLQQYHTERILHETAQKLKGVIEINWNTTVTNVDQGDNGVTLTLDNGEAVHSPYAIAADGCRSPMRQMLNQDFPGSTGRDYFIIADVKADLPFDAEHRFTFEPPSGQGNTQLIVPQPEGLWRLDWQLFPEQQPECEMTPHSLAQRIINTIGEVPYELVWASCYKFHQRMMEQFRHGRVFFMGDAAHLVSPFGGRGMNTGFRDAENLAWKMGAVLRGTSPETLLSTYDDERLPAAREDQEVTGKSIQFIAPDPENRDERNAILRRSEQEASFREKVDSGKMSQPHHYQQSPILAGTHPNVGRKAPDIYLGKSGFLRNHIGRHPMVLQFGDTIADETPLFLNITVPQENTVAFNAFCASEGDCFIIRPDGHIGGVCRENEVTTTTERVMGNHTTSV